MKAGQTIEVVRVEKIRVPKVASYAYQLLARMFTLTGLPLDVRTGPLGVGEEGGTRFQLNWAELHFPGQHFRAQVRSWENVEAPNGPKRKTLQSLIATFRFHTEEGLREWEKQNYNVLTHSSQSYDEVNPDRERPFQIKLFFDNDLLALLKVKIIVP